MYVCTSYVFHGNAFVHSTGGEMKRRKKKEDGSGSGSGSPSPPGPTPQKDVLRVIRDLLVSTYSGVSVQGAGQLCSILLGDV